jgi:CBS domain-containing protein
MKVKALMTREVVRVTPQTPLKQVARLLAKHGISGVPVCDRDGSVVGVVTEADILLKEAGLRSGRGGPLAWLVDGSDVTKTRKSLARTAGEAMSSPPVTTSPWRTVSEAARLMLDRRVNRLPVLDGTRLVGILSRADLVRAFKRDDEDIEREIREEAIGESLWVSHDDVGVGIKSGQITLRGRVKARSDAGLLVAFVSTVPGVVGVRSELVWETDDVAHLLPRNVPTG